jgi:RNA polymerase sigma-70 factor, ECF subfamily
MLRSKTMQKVAEAQRGSTRVDWPPSLAERGGMIAEPASNSHEALIIAIARHGDRRAFAALFAHFAPRVKRWLQRAGTDAGLAEEIAQEVLLTVWRKAAQYDPARAAAGGWIFGIARNLRIDSVRSSSRLITEPDPSEEPMPIPLADAIVAAEERAQRLRAALGDLPPEQLTLLQMAFFQELSHSEIEAVLGVPLGTVKSRLRLAMSKLRAALKDEA